MLLSRESTKVKTAIMAKMPMVTPSNDSVVLNKLLRNADSAKMRLSFMSLATNTITIYALLEPLLPIL